MQGENPPATAKAINYLGAGVNSDGTVTAGRGFTVTHPSAGVYVLHFKAGSFTKLPAFSCTPWNIVTFAAICNVFSVDWTSATKPTNIEIDLYTRNDGSYVDNAFMLTEITTH